MEPPAKTGVNTNIYFRGEQSEEEEQGFWTELCSDLRNLFSSSPQRSSIEKTQDQVPFQQPLLSDSNLEKKHIMQLTNDKQIIEFFKELTKCQANEINELKQNAKDKETKLATIQTAWNKFCNDILIASQPQSSDIELNALSGSVADDSEKVLQFVQSQFRAAMEEKQKLEMQNRQFINSIKQLIPLSPTTQPLIEFIQSHEQGNRPVLGSELETPKPGTINYFENLYKETYLLKSDSEKNYREIEEVFKQFAIENQELPQDQKSAIPRLQKENERLQQKLGMLTVEVSDEIERLRLDAGGTSEDYLSTLRDGWNTAIVNAQIAQFRLMILQNYDASLLSLLDFSKKAQALICKVDTVAENANAITINTAEAMDEIVREVETLKLELVSLESERTLLENDISKLIEKHKNVADKIERCTYPPNFILHDPHASGYHLYQSSLTENAKNNLKRVEDMWNQCQIAMSDSKETLAAIVEM